MKIGAALVLMVLSLAPSAVPARADSFSNQVDEELLIIFQSMDVDGDGLVSPREADRMITLTFNAIDVNHDRRITPEEFKDFSMGFLYLAQVRDRVAQFNAVKSEVFRRWDTNKTGYLDFRDYRGGILNELTRAASKGNPADPELSPQDMRNVRFLREMAEALQ
ncbi:MAG TPA: EF-hand domain-containing protein [Acetobacteraceae bacterium]|nr:EF-hand domain-containing protein [Acetobacteraceae bacterium]